MGSITCVQGQAEGHREPLVLVPISEGIPQDILESFRVQEGQEDLHLTPEWEQLTPLFSGEMREFLPARLEDLDWSSRESVRATAPQLIRYTHGPGRSLNCCTCQRYRDQRGHKPELTVGR